MKTRYALSLLAALIATPALADEQPLSELPAPVQAYVFQKAVELGDPDPWSITTVTFPEFAPPFEVIGSPGGDLNADGHPDYAVSTCLFSSLMFQTNGYPCAFGSLILSSPYGGYRFIEVSGLIVDSVPHKREPLIVVAEQGFGRCGGDEYMCKVTYRVADELELLSTAAAE